MGIYFLSPICDLKIVEHVCRLQDKIVEQDGHERDMYMMQTVNNSYTIKLSGIKIIVYCRWFLSSKWGPGNQNALGVLST